MIESLAQRYGYLPDPLRRVLEAAGEDAMFRLVSACGGVRISIPRRLRDDCDLVRAVGREAAEQIARRLRADHLERIDVPVMSAMMARRRRARILALREEGVKVAEIARRLGMTERGVYLALAKAREERADSRQLALFA